MANHRVLVTAFLVVFTTTFAVGEVVGGFVIPHGDFAFDPSLVHDTNGSLKVHDACIGVGRSIHALKPDIVFLSTPHGNEDSNSFMFYFNSLGAGWADIGSDLHNASHPTYRVPLPSVPLAKNRTGLLLKALHDENASTLLSFADGAQVGVSASESRCSRVILCTKG